jgi:hypothetical protein
VSPFCTGVPFTVTSHNRISQTCIDVVVVMVVIGLEVVVDVDVVEVVEVEVDVVVKVREVMSVVVLVGVLPGLTDVVVLELVVVLLVLWAATWLCNDAEDSVGDLDLQLR